MKDVVLSVGYRVDTQFCYSFSTSTEYWKASNPFLTTIGLLVAQSSLNVGWSTALHIELCSALAGCRGSSRRLCCYKLFLQVLSLNQPCLVLSGIVGLVQSCPVSSCLVWSCVWSGLVRSCMVMSDLVRSCPFMPDHVRSWKDFYSPWPKAIV